MSAWMIATLVYLGLLAATLVPVLLAVFQTIPLLPGGDGPETSPIFSDATKTRLAQHHSRMMGTLGFWKKQAEKNRRFHFYAMFWLVLSAVTTPLLAQAVSADPWSKWFLSVVAGSNAVLLSFHRWLKTEQNYKAFRLAESTYYDMRRRLLDRPTSYGKSEDKQLDTYFAGVEAVRQRARDAEIDNFPGSELPTTREPPVARELPERTPDA